jgi:hypothetical protein
VGLLSGHNIISSRAIFQYRLLDPLLTSPTKPTMSVHGGIVLQNSFLSWGELGF